MTSGVDSAAQISFLWVTRSMGGRDLRESYRPLLLMSSSMPDRRRVSLAPVNTLAPSGISSLTRARAAAAPSRISTAKYLAVRAAAARSRRCAGTGSVNDVAGIEVVTVSPELPARWMMRSSDQYDKAAGPNVRRGAGLAFRPAALPNW